MPDSTGIPPNQTSSPRHGEVGGWQNVDPESARFGQVTLGTLPLLPALSHLEVASSDTDDAGLLALEHQPALARLSIADCQVPANTVHPTHMYLQCRLPSNTCIRCILTYSRRWMEAGLVGRGS